MDRWNILFCFHIITNIFTVKRDKTRKDESGINSKILNCIYHCSRSCSCYRTNPSVVLREWCRINYWINLWSINYSKNFNCCNNDWIWRIFQVQSTKKCRKKSSIWKNYCPQKAKEITQSWCNFRNYAIRSSCIANKWNSTSRRNTKSWCARDYLWF